MVEYHLKVLYDFIQSISQHSRVLNLVLHRDCKFAKYYTDGCCRVGVRQGDVKLRFC